LFDAFKIKVFNSTDNFAIVIFKTLNGFYKSKHFVDIGSVSLGSVPLALFPLALSPLNEGQTRIFFMFSICILLLYVNLLKSPY